MGKRSRGAAFVNSAAKGVLSFLGGLSGWVKGVGLLVVGAGAVWAFLEPRANAQIDNLAVWVAALIAAGLVVTGIVFAGILLRYSSAVRGLVSWHTHQAILVGEIEEMRNSVESAGGDVVSRDRVEAFNDLLCHAKKRWGDKITLGDLSANPPGPFSTDLVSKLDRLETQIRRTS